MFESENKRKFAKEFHYDLSTEGLMEDFETVEVMLRSESDWYEFFDNWWRNCRYSNWKAGYSEFIETADRRQSVVTLASASTSIEKNEYKKINKNGSSK